VGIFLPAGKAGIFAIWISATIHFVLCESAFSDTVRLKDGREEKGVVIERYSDRIVFSQEEGEAQILKKDIQEIIYDTKEQNFLVIGNLYKEKDNLDKAIEYYKKALAEKPNFKEARDAISLVTTLKLRRKEFEKKEEIIRRAEISGVVTPKKNSGIKTARERIRETIGVTYEKNTEGVMIKQLLKGSPAEISGLKGGDLIVSIWGNLIGYSSEEDIERLLLDPKYKELRLIIQREIILPVSVSANDIERQLGFNIILDEQGFRASDIPENSPASEAGINNGDIIYKINDDQIRYTGLDKVRALAQEKAREGPLKLLIRREISLIRKE
jgi:C-terminal processing protease CtpA/Prc